MRSITDQIAWLRYRVEEALAHTSLPGPPGPPGPGSAFVIPFTFATASPLVIQPIAAGQAIGRVAVVFTTPFSDPTATFQAGTIGTGPGSLLAAADNKPSTTTQYENDAVVRFLAPDTLRLTITPGASITGAGYFYYEIA